MGGGLDVQRHQGREEWGVTRDLNSWGEWNVGEEESAAVGVGPGGPGC